MTEGGTIARQFSTVGAASPRARQAIELDDPAGRWRSANLRVVGDVRHAVRTPLTGGDSNGWAALTGGLAIVGAALLKAIPIDCTC